MLHVLPHLLAALAGGAPSTPAPEAAPPAAPEPLVQDEPVKNKWTGSVNLGASVTSGNVDNRNASANAQVEYRREHDRTTLGFWWNYAEQEDADSGESEITDRRTGGRAQYDYFLTKKTYLLGQAAAENNLVSDIELRTTIGAGIGHQFREDERYKLNGELGLSWFDENFYSSPDDNYIAARGAYNFTWVINPRYEFFNGAVIFPSLEDADDVYARVDTRFKATLTEKMFAQLQWLFDWDNTPAEDFGRKDNRYLLTVGWSF
jgi:putative salt-induced outer membrane protein YdiY